MNKNVVILGGGTGLSYLVKGLKMFPLNLSTIVSVCDDGKSTGILRKEFNIPAVGDLRKVLIALSETEPLFKQLLDYRFETTSDLNGHTVGNLLLTAMANITGNMSDGIESIEKVLNLKGKLIPLTEDEVTLVGLMDDGKEVIGEHLITKDSRKVNSVRYLEEPTVNLKAIHAIEHADLVILSMGSLYTSIIPNLICKEVLAALDNSKAKIMYVSNMFTQPGETENYKLSDHIKLLNKYLGNKKITTVITNNGKISSEMAKKYQTLEQKEPVEIDYKNISKNVKLIKGDFVVIEEDSIKHDSLKVALKIFMELM